MALTQEFVDQAGSALAEHCPKASASPESIGRIKAKILGYDETIGQPSVNHVLAWGRDEERKLQEAIDADNSAYEASRERIAARKKAIADDLAPSSVAREEMIRERAHQTANQPTPVPFRPRKNFTDEEIDAMDSETYRREIFGDDRNFGRQPQGESRSIDFKTERPGKRKGKKLPAEETASREYRNSVIEANKEERKKLQKALKAAARKTGR